MKYFDKEHPTKINYEKLRKLLHKNHIPGQIYLNKGLPCEFKVPEKKAKRVASRSRCVSQKRKQKARRRGRSRKRRLCQRVVSEGGVSGAVRRRLVASASAAQTHDDPRRLRPQRTRVCEDAPVPLGPWRQRRQEVFCTKRRAAARATGVA